jgi:hypothetical protein
MNQLKAVALAISALACGAQSAHAQQYELVLRWEQDVRSLRGAIGKRVAIMCPPGGEPARVFGTDEYTDDSSVCSAAVHAGAITANEGGSVVLVIGPARGSFRASTQNGVTSQSYGSWPGSFSFDKSGAPGQIDWVTVAKNIWEPVTVVCPPNGAPAPLWGTDSYTVDSSICTAAAHAGVITIAGGGPVTVSPAAGLNEYKASERNGVTSRSYSAWPASIQVAAGGTTPRTAANVPPPTTQPAQPMPEPTQPPQTQQPPTSAPTGPVQAQTGKTPVATRDNANRNAVTTDAPLAAPANPAALYLSGGRVAVAWDAVPDAVSYDIVSTIPGGSGKAGINLEAIHGTQHVTRALTEGTYQFEVVANMSGTNAGPFSPASVPVTVVVPRWSGKYRVTVNGFRVNHETADNPAEMDGKRDEIYVETVATVVHVLGPTINTTRARTKTHGDVNAARWQGANNPNVRIKAGSASPLGGLMTGDGYPDRLMPWKRSSTADYTHTFPLLVWEGDVMQDVYSVVVVPAIYEDDEVQEQLIADRYMNVFTTLGHPVEDSGATNLRNVRASMFRKLTATLHRTPADARDYAERILKPLATKNVKAMQRLTATNTFFSNASTQMTALMSTIALTMNNRDRPIGLVRRSNGSNDFDPAALFIDFESAEKIIAGTAEGSLSPGIVAIDYKDHVPGGGGDYTLFVEVRRVN